jgi:hypothetical protein
LSRQSAHRWHCTPQIHSWSDDIIAVSSVNVAIGVFSVSGNSAVGIRYRKGRFRSPASAVFEGLAGTAWEPSKLLNYVSVTPTLQTVVSHTTTLQLSSLSLSQWRFECSFYSRSICN